MWYPMLRSWRSVILVALALGWAAIGRTMPVPIAGLALIIGWVITLGLVLSNHPVLWAMPVRDQLLVQGYQACVDQLGALWAQSGTREARSYLDELNRCIHCFASLD